MSNILVPTDFSKNAEAALRYGIQLANQMKKGLLIFHCSHISAYALSAASSEAEMAKLLKEDEEHKMEKLEGEVRNAYQFCGINAVPPDTKCMVSYHPLLVEKTLDIARENNISLIVMGTHGASGITKFFFGSNTSVMISKSFIPVLAIPETYEYAPIQKIVFASDLEKLHPELLQLLPFAQANEAELTILYLDYGIDADDRKIQTARKLIQESGYEKLQLYVQHASLETSLVSQLKKYINNIRPDCLVMFTRERSLWDRLFLKGSKTTDMSTALSVPLLSFKKMN